MAQKGMKGLLEWCKKHTEGYKDVEVKNMSSSWKDGLAFCALLHRFRPDLIDFDALSKENVLYNNQLAFDIAENELGIAALLDAEDMANMKSPDRLSIMTYLSQYYSCFRNCQPCEPNADHAVVNPVQSTNTLERNKKTSLESICAICGKRVHLVQRYFEEGKLYHRICHRNNSLEQIRGKNYFIKQQPDKQVETENAASIDGKHGKNSTQSVSVPKVAVLEQKNEVPSEEKDTNSTDLVKNNVESEMRPVEISQPKAKERTLPSSKGVPTHAPAARPRTKTSNGVDSTSEKDYDETLNPFGSDTSDDEELLSSSSSSESDSALNPFESSENSSSVGNDTKTDATTGEAGTKVEDSESENEGNPFGDDDIDEVDDNAGYGNPFGDCNEGETAAAAVAVSEPKPNPSNRINPFTKEKLDDLGSADEKKKKRPAPAPPKNAPPRPANSPAQKLGAAGLKKSPAPPPPTWKLEASKKMAQMNSTNDSDPRFQKNRPTEPKSSSKLPKSPMHKMDRFKLRRLSAPKSRAAPGYGHPLVKRKVEIKMTEEEITTELKLLDVKLTDYETKGVKLEEMLRFAMAGDVEWTKEEDELLNEWFELVNKKNILLREESDLVFQLQQQRLEQEHADIEFELRKLLNKPDSSKSQKDKEDEEELLQKLVEVVERRNVIINSIEEERLKEAEEDSAYDQMKWMKTNPSKKKKKNKVKKMFSKKDKKQKNAQTKPQPPS